MSFRTFQEGLRLATDTASKAITAESSLPSLSPLVSPLPTLQRTFTLYIASAESYSHLLSSGLVPAHEKEAIRKRWRLVLERAEKVKKRIEGLGGHVAKIDPGDEGTESAVVRRGGLMNGCKLDLWREPSPREFEGAEYKEVKEPDMPDVDVVWKDIGRGEWECDVGKEEIWTVRQGTGADCSVAAGLGVSLEHNRLWDSKLGSSSLYPQSPLQPRRSENGKHVVKLLLNGAWRGVIIDALLPYSATTSKPLHATTQPISSHSKSIGPPWIPLATKAYYKALGGYTIRGSDPGPDIYAFTGWIPERLSLKEGFQREKEWRRIYKAWSEGKVLVTLGTGKVVQRDLVPFHAYGVIGLREEKGERVLDIVDPGSTPRQSDGVLEESMDQLSLQPKEGSFTMTWDQVCGDFEAISLNWDPALYRNMAIRHWSWSKKPDEAEARESGQDSSPRYRLSLRGSKADEVCIMLSQHTTNKDRPLDDIALHVFEEHDPASSTRVLHPQRAESASPYSNGLHVLVRLTPRRPNSDLAIIASRDRGIFQRDFTLQAFAPSSTQLSLERVKASLPFSYTVNGHLNSRNAGGHPGNPSHMINPQYKVVIRPDTGKVKGVVRMVVQGDREIPWNVKLVWGNGTRVTDLSEDAVIADSGAYSFGMACCDVSDIQAGTYTAIVSTFDSGTIAPFSVQFESDRALGIDAIPAEGAGLYSRVVHGRWIKGQSAGGRPSAGSYGSNPKVEVILPRPGSITARLNLPEPLGHPINLTVFKRNTDGALGDQVATTGPYSDTLSGVCIVKTKLEAGIYLFIPSTYDKGTECAWTLNVWSDVGLSAENAK